MDTEEQTLDLAEHPEGASNEKAEASEGKPEAKTVPITETPEFKAMVEATAAKLAQSMKDKELKPLYERLDKAERERKAEREAREAVERQQREETEIGNLYNGLIEEGVSEESAATFRDKAKKLSRDLVKKAMEHNTVVERFTQEKTTVEERQKSLSLTETMLKVLDAAETQGKILRKSEAESIAKESEGNQKLIEYMVKMSGEQPNIPSETGQRKRPDSGLSTVSGSRKTDEEIVKDYIAGRLSPVAYEEECKKRNLDPSGGLKKPS